VKKRISKLVSIWLMVVFMITLTTIANAQEKPNAPVNTINNNRINTRLAKYFYVHGLATLGFDVYKSSDINSLFTNDMHIQTIGFPLQYGIRAGFRHIIQFEYHASSSSAHNIGTVTGYVNGQWVGESVPMKLKATDMLFKINPIAWTWMDVPQKSRADCLFVIVGSGRAKYKDKINEGFEGSGMIYGMEWAGISKYASFSIGMTIQSITYDKARLFGNNFSSNLNASRFILYTSLGLGYGI
jgi:hypothetical protein